MKKRVFIGVLCLCILGVIVVCISKTSKTGQNTIPTPSAAMFDVEQPYEYLFNGLISHLCQDSTYELIIPSLIVWTCFDIEDGSIGYYCSAEIAYYDIDGSSIADESRKVSRFIIITKDDKVSSVNQVEEHERENVLLSYGLSQFLDDYLSGNAVPLMQMKETTELLKEYMEQTNFPTVS